MKTSIFPTKEKKIALPWLARLALAVAMAAVGLPTQALDLKAEPVADQDQIAQLEQASDADLKLFYLRCSRSDRFALGMGGVAVCSIGYELLLQRTFAGDFYALLDWSRRHPVTGYEKMQLEARGPEGGNSPRGIWAD